MGHGTPTEDLLRLGNVNKARRIYCTLRYLRNDKRSLFHFPTITKGLQSNQTLTAN